MALDAATLALTARELDARLAGARVDKIFQPTRDEVVLMMRSRAGGAKLLLSARSGAARIGVTTESFENPQVPPSFCMLLRKYFSGGRLDGVHAEKGERLVFFDFTCTSEMGDQVPVTLAAELMGRYANIVVVNGERRVVDALKRVDLDASAVRPLLPGLAYTLPPRQDKPDFFETDENEFLRRVFSFDAPAADAVMKAVSGIGPAVCREIAYRALGEGRFFTGELDAGQKQALAAAAAGIRAEFAAADGPPWWWTRRVSRWSTALPPHPVPAPLRAAPLREATAACWRTTTRPRTRLSGCGRKAATWARRCRTSASGQSASRPPAWKSRPPPRKPTTCGSGASCCRPTSTPCSAGPRRPRWRTTTTGAQVTIPLDVRLPRRPTRSGISRSTRKSRPPRGC